VQDYADLLGHKSLKEVEAKVGNTDTNVEEIKAIVSRLERTVSTTVEAKMSEDQWRDRALMLLAARFQSLEMVFQRAIALGMINDLLGSETPKMLEYTCTWHATFLNCVLPGRWPCPWLGIAPRTLLLPRFDADRVNIQRAAARFLMVRVDHDAMVKMRERRATTTRKTTTKSRWNRMTS
jgi:hypothetical protein